MYGFQGRFGVALVTLLLSAFAPGVARAATECVNANAPAPLEFCMQDGGRPAVFVLQPNGRTRQYYAQYDWGSVVWLNGTNTTFRYTTGYQGPAGVTAVSNTRTGTGTAADPWVVTNITNLGATGVQMAQVYRYVNGDRTLRKSFTLTNNGSSTFTDVRFFHGGDTFFGGDDAARSWYDSTNKMVYVTNAAFTNSGFMGFYANPATPSTAYFGGYWSSGNDYAKSIAQLPNSADSAFIDAGYYLQWNRVSLTPGQTWSIDSYEVWSPPGAVQVLSPANDYVASGTTVTRTFRVQNLSAGPLTIALSAVATPDGWTATLQGASSVLVDTLAVVDVLVDIVVPPGASPGATQDVTLSAVATTNTAVGATRLTVLQADYVIAPAPLAFGSVSLGNSSDLSITLTNGAAAAAVQVGAVGAANPLAAPYSIVADTCSNTTVAAAGTCAVTVRFTPTATPQADDSFSIPILAPVITTRTMAVSGSSPPSSYLVTASAGAGGSMAPGSQTVISGNTTSFTVTPDAGYSISGGTGCGGSLAGSTYTTAAISGDCTVGATFALNSYTVSAAAGTGGAITPASASVAHGSMTSFTVTADIGFSITGATGCAGALAGNVYTTGTIGGACSVAATFALNSYTVSANAGAGGGIAPASTQVNYGSTTSFVVTPEAGHSIASVSGCAGTLTGSIYDTGVVTAGCAVSATFSFDSYTVSASAGAHGSISPASAVVDHGATTSFTLTPAAGYSIAAVTGCGGTLIGNTYTTGVVQSACSVAATFGLTLPVFTPAMPATIDLQSTGLTTQLPADSNPTAVDLAGTPLGVTLVGGKTEFAPGAYTLTWHTVDSRGVEATVQQILRVWPIVSVGPDISLGYVAGNSGSFRIALNGLAPVYPFDISYAVSGFLQDHDLVSGSVQLVDGEIDKDVYLAITASPAAGAPPQRVDVALDDSVNNRGARRALSIALITANVPATVNVTATQEGQSRPAFAHGANLPVTLRVEILDPNSADIHTVTWTTPAGAVFTIVNGTLVLDPMSLPVGVHHFTVAVRDNGSPAATTTLGFDLVLTAIAPVLPVGSVGWAESALPANPMYSPPTRNVLPGQAQDLEHGLLEAAPGVQLALGSSAREQALPQAGLTAATVSSLAADGVVNSGGMFDFEIRSLPQVGQSTSLVIAQTAPIGAHAVYRVYDPVARTWSSFVAGANDSLASAPSVGGTCPPPASAAYQPGLVAGNSCVRLTISDGGPNDADHGSNGHIASLGGVAAMNEVTVAASGRGKGGGAIDPLFLIFGLTMLALRLTPRRRLAVLAACVLPALVSAGENSGWYVGGQWGTASAGTSERDMNGRLAALGHDVTVDFEHGSRPAWKLFGGYHFSRYLGLQLGYTNLGEVESRLSGNIIDVDQLLMDVTRIHPHSADGPEAALVARLPFGSRLALTGRAGVMAWSSTYHAFNSQGEEFARFTDSGSGLVLGAGLAMRLTPQWDINAGFSRYDVDGEVVPVVSVGVSWSLAPPGNR
ncbi:MAG: hypothetical protein ABI769_10290 [Pseudomonadota bacterium]